MKIQSLFVRKLFINCITCGMAVAVLLFLLASTTFALNFTPDTLSGTTFSFFDGDRSASADFAFAGDMLTITFTNTFTGDVPDPIHVLQALWFDLAGNHVLTPLTAYLNTGSAVLYDYDLPDLFDGNVGGEFAYRSGLSGAPNGAQQGISGVGYGIFSPHDVFPGPDLDGPAAPGGMNYGLVSSGYAATGNRKVTGMDPLIMNSVIFTFSGVSGLGIGDVSNVSFEYGTEVTPVPEPTTILLLGGGLVGLAFWKRNLKK
jgi:hypothetical protein